MGSGFLGSISKRFYVEINVGCRNQNFHDSVVTFDTGERAAHSLINPLSCSFHLSFSSHSTRPPSVLMLTSKPGSPSSQVTTSSALLAAATVRPDHLPSSVTQLMSTPRLSAILAFATLFLLQLSMNTCKTINLFFIPSHIFPYPSAFRDCNLQIVFRRCQNHLCWG